MREMKDSGIEWIGEIPNTWKIMRNKNTFLCNKNLVGTKSVNTQLLSLTTKGIRKKDINNAEGKLPESFDTYQYVKEDDIVMCLFDLDCSAVFSGISYYNGMISPAYRVLTCKKSILPKYAHYWFNYISDGRKFNHYAKNIRYTISYDEFSTLPVLCPDIETQQKISTYLDDKYTKIDTIIEKQQKIIEKLKDYKLSLITETVTKGLNPDAKMKDSGVEWIGKIPENWNMIRIKWLLDERKERSEKGMEEPLSMSQKYGLIPTKEMDIIPNLASTYVGAKIVYSNDLVFNKLKAHLGVFSVSRYYGLVSPDYAVYYSTGKAELKYLEYLFKTPQCILEFRKKSSGVADGLTRLYTIGLFSIYCPFPHIEEQKQIVDYLNKKCSAIDSAIEKKQAIIEKLTEYKKSLIYEVVTGKKEVYTPKKIIAVLYPIGIPTNEEEYAKILLIQKIITRCGKNLKGRIHLMKIFHALEIEMGFSFYSKYTRYTHGPYDKKIEKYESELVRKGWIKLKKGKKIEYIVVNHTAYKTDYNRIFAKYNKEIERIIDFFKSMKRASKAGKVATLLASWNDFLIDGIRKPTDNMIITDVMTNWTKNKGNIDYSTWQTILSQMKISKIVPHGYGRHTIRMED